MFPSVWHPNTQIQRHKYTIHKYSFGQIIRNIMWYIFEKVMVRGLQKQCSQVKNKNLENLENLET